MSVLFLFGAGASYGSETEDSRKPAMGAGLFKELRNRFPESWGCLESNFGQLFQKDFELAMNAILLEKPVDVGILQRDMAMYFMDFSPTVDSQYVKLIQVLSSQIENVAFATLNYERLLEQSAFLVGIRPSIFGQINAESDRQIEICYPHGACHFFLIGFDIPAGSLSFHYGQNRFDSAVKVVRDSSQALNRLKSNAMPPVMACFNTQKTCATGNRFIATQKNRLKELIATSRLIVIIGVQVREHDDHIWTPLKETKATLLYCSGRGATTFKDWHEKNRTDHSKYICEGHFKENLDEICSFIENSIVSL